MYAYSSITGVSVAPGTTRRMKVGGRQDWLASRGGTPFDAGSSGMPRDSLLQSEIDEQVPLRAFAPRERACFSSPLCSASGGMTRTPWRRAGGWLTQRSNAHEQAARKREMLAAKREENIRR